MAKEKHVRMAALQGRAAELGSPGPPEEGEVIEPTARPLRSIDGLARW
jgi:hypothetical protein